jgi:cytochrome c oxidase subunit III
MASFGVDMEKDKRNYIVHPYKFNLWLFLLTVIMVFGGLTSAYIVALSFVDEANRIFFTLPRILWQNLAVILFSSVTMQYAVWTAKREETKKAMIGLILTLILGVVFLVGQLAAWSELTFLQELPFVDPMRKDNSVTFLYVFTFLHGAHIIAGLLVLIVTLIRNNLNKFNTTRGLAFELAATFWHFLGLLWIYLFVVLYYYTEIH